MPEIEITYPKIKINLLEIDDHIPSFKISMYHHNQGMRYENSYYYEFWIKTEDWDIFINNLKEKKKAVLLDMNDNHRITICNSVMYLNFSNKNEYLEYKSICSFVKPV
ncbi:hypothetical protein [Capnocytophaga felis]|uniref:Uncharacterized protein n=1 Tax=Capnocytophaga felis TaxID=2267611 RepID=A0A5M4BAT9_9FLAO|nr:hypothetical protein [Capnocytophaga felis]GET46530.1 hypothetical protein RCZ01_18320 [Capnocytophaga felis]GET49004.1 hypothetical protein RCZ02_18350 [Capnocytophaga felis]